MNAAKAVSQAPLYYLRGGSSATAPNIIQRVKEMQKEMQTGGGLLIILDYLQFWARFTGGRNQYDQIGQSLLQVRQIIDETGAALVLISSQNRETNQNGKSTQFGARGSGEVEYDCDCYLTLTKVKPSTKASTQVRPCTKAKNLPINTSMKMAPFSKCQLSVVNARFGGNDTSCELDFNEDYAYFEVAGESWDKETSGGHRAN